MTKQFTLNLETLDGLNREEVEAKLKDLVDEKSRLLVFLDGNAYPELVKVHFYSEIGKKFADDEEPFVNLHTVHEDVELVDLSSVNYVAKLGKID